MMGVHSMCKIQVAQKWVKQREQGGPEHIISVRGSWEADHLGGPYDFITFSSNLHSDSTFKLRAGNLDVIEFLKKDLAYTIVYEMPMTTTALDFLVLEPEDRLKKFKTE